MKKATLLFGAYLYFILFCTAQTPKLLVLALDGARPDAIQVANTPNLDALMSNGVYSFDAYTRFPTKTKPGWSSLYTGVWKERHRVMSNDATGNNLQRFPYFIKHLKNSNPLLEAAWITGNGQSPIQNHVANFIDLQFFDYMDDIKKNLAIDLLTNQNPDVLILHLGFIDFHGHVYSFSPTTPQYIDAIELADLQIGEVLSAIANRPDYANEDWLIMGASDHGGNGLNHGGSSIEDRNIIFFVSGDNVTNQQIQAKDTYAEVLNAPFFNGNDNYITIPNNQNRAFNQNQNFSIECRVLLTDTINTQIIMSNQDGYNALYKGFSISVNPQVDKEMIINISDGNAHVYLHGPELTDAKPHHISVTFDRDEFMSLYVDGYLYDAKRIDHLDDFYSVKDLVIGQSGANNHNHYFQGSISEVRIWDCLLSEAAIADYACIMLDNLHPHQQKLAAHYPLDEDTGSIFMNLVDSGSSATGHGSNFLRGPFTSKIRCLNYNSTPRIIDGAPTMLDHFCVPRNPYWEMDGKSWISNAPCNYDTCARIMTTGDKDITFNSATLTWSSDYLPHHYILRGKRPEDEFFRYFTISDPLDTSFLVTKLRPNTYYIWQIQTVCDTNELIFSDFTPLDTVRTLECIIPEELTVDSITDISARLSWERSNQASFYRVLGFSNLPEEEIMDFVLTGSSSTQMEMLSLSSGTDYYWKVRAECGIGYYSNYSGIDTFTTLVAKNDEFYIDSGQINNETLLIYPNPLVTTSSIHFNNPEGDSHELTVTNNAGSIVRLIKGIHSNRYILNRGTLSAGVYTLDLNGTNRHLNAKLVVK